MQVKTIGANDRINIEIGLKLTHIPPSSHSVSEFLLAKQRENASSRSLSNRHAVPTNLH